MLLLSSWPSSSSVLTRPLWYLGFDSPPTPTPLTPAPYPNPCHRTPCHPTALHPNLNPVHSTLPHRAPQRHTLTLHAIQLVPTPLLAPTRAHISTPAPFPRQVNASIVEGRASFRNAVRAQKKASVPASIATSSPFKSGALESQATPPTAKPESKPNGLNGTVTFARKTCEFLRTFQIYMRRKRSRG